MKRFRATLSTAIAWLILTAILTAPVIAYVATFGSKISDDHQRWAEMGSAMSGIYGPVIAFLAFIVLIFQVRMQGDTNKHMYDQAYIQEARADVEFYLARLEEILDKPSFNGETPRNVLHTAFQLATVEELSSEQLRGFGRTLNQQVPHLQSMWSAIYSVYEGLRVDKEQPYALQFSSAKQKAYAMLSFPTCVALDNFLYCMSEERIKYHYNFNNLLPAP